MSGKRARGFHLLIAIAVLALDRVTKWLIASRMSLHDGVTVIPHFFRIVHVEHRATAERRE